MYVCMCVNVCKCVYVSVCMCECCMCVCVCARGEYDTRIQQLNDYPELVTQVGGRCVWGWGCACINM